VPAQLIETALAEWREGERVLRDLPRLDPDHETVRLAVMGLRDTYHELAQLSVATAEQLAGCRERIEAAREVIASSRARLDGGRGA
jgi:hypothetical protein